MTETPYCPGVGDPVPEIVLPSLDGDLIRLSAHRGKRLLLFMWGSW